MSKVVFPGMAVLAAVSLFAVSCASVESPGAPAAAPRAKIGVYIDKGARNIGAFRWIEIATRANDAEAVCIDCDAIRAGALDGLDMLIMPGGKASLEAYFELQLNIKRIVKYDSLYALGRENGLRIAH